jgi:serine/threonine-protein kinase RsbW
MATRDNPWIWQRDYVIPTRSGAERPVVEEILGQLQLHRWCERDVFGVHLALEEALTNAIKHGNQFDAQKRIEIACRIAPDSLHLEIADEGRGFDPNRIPDPTESRHLETPCGRGIMLMRSFMSRVEFNEVGNRVILEKQRDPSN